MVFFVLEECIYLIIAGQQPSILNCVNSNSSTDIDVINNQNQNNYFDKTDLPNRRYLFIGHVFQSVKNVKKVNNFQY